MSRAVKIESVAFKIRVPKRTGRKRKRGSDDPYVEDSSPATKQTPAGEDVLKRIQDNPDAYHIEAVGHVNETHRFRTMPDFVSSTSGIPFLDKVKSHVLPFDFDKMKNFELSPAQGAPPNLYISPPRFFSNVPQPYNYSYRQNPAVKVKHDFTTGKTTFLNTQQFERLHIMPFAINSTNLPTDMPDSLPPLESLSKNNQTGIAKLRALIATRPIVTRRVGLNHIGHTFEHVFKHISQYCGYQFRSGPWRDTLVRYGVDPRTDPAYRQYQTVMFQLRPPATNPSGEIARNGEVNGSAAEKAAAAAGNAEMSAGKWRWNKNPRHRLKDGEQSSHIFDGRRLWTDGKVWQLCDIECPLLRELLDKSPLRQQCDLEGDGWFANGTSAKLRVIMKDMINVLMINLPWDAAPEDEPEQGPSEEDEKIWRDIAELMPDILDDRSLNLSYVVENRRHKRLEELMTQVRAMAKRAADAKYKDGAHEMGMFNASRNAAVRESNGLVTDENLENEDFIDTESEAVDGTNGAGNGNAVESVDANVEIEDEEDEEDEDEEDKVERSALLDTFSPNGKRTSQFVDFTNRAMQDLK